MNTARNKRPLIQLENVAIGYKSKIVGHDISFDINAGEVFCLLGPNGSGKSTLFKTIMGLLKASSGTVYINNKPINSWSTRELAHYVGYVPQAQPASFPFLVSDIVLMGRYATLRAFSSPKKDDYKIALESLSALGIEHLYERRYTELSGGERQLVLLARALAQKPAVIIMDEPTASLDFGNQVMVLEVITSLAERNIGVLFCTHQPEHAAIVADRIALLRNGSLLDVGTVNKILTVDNLAGLYSLPIDKVRRLLDSNIK